MRSLSLAVLCVLCACGPDISGWKGSWRGTAVINTGRLPLIVPGTLTVADGARFTMTSDGYGTPAQIFSCGLTAATVDSASAAFTGPGPCDLQVTPAGNCTYAVTVNSASATRSDIKMTGTVNGRVTTTCTGASNTIEDFSMDFTGDFLNPR